MSIISPGAAQNRAIFEAVRGHDYDRYLSALLTRDPPRSGLMSLYAFAAEIARVPELVSEPVLGEIRLQWWRDTISAGNSATGSPIADAVVATCVTHALPVGLLLGMIDARSFDVAGDTMPDEPHLTAYLAKTEGALLNLSARVLGATEGETLEAAAAAGGEALGLTRLLLALPRQLSKRRVMVPETLLRASGASVEELLAGSDSASITRALDQLRDRAHAAVRLAAPSLAQLPRATRSAFLPLALVGGYLSAMQRQGSDPLRDIVDLSPLTRVWRLWRAHRTGRVL